MFEQIEYSQTIDKNYHMLIKQLEALIEDEQDPIANLSNSAALLNQFLDRINWVGFYIMRNDELVLGPFQGLPACVRIGVGKGVCGTAVKEKATQRVKDVHAFPGHIACDPKSQSEIVIPLIKDNKVIGVLDIDSPELNRFDETDQTFLEKFTDVLVKHLPATL